MSQPLVQACHSRVRGPLGVITWVTAIATLGLAAACGDGPVAAHDAQQLSLNVVSGDSQVGPPYQELPQPLVVQVVDRRNRPVNGQVLNFRVVDGGGSVFAGAAQTDRSGIAQEYWTLGDPGFQRLEARAVSPDGEKQVFGTFYAWAEGSPGAIPAYLECFDEFSFRWITGGPCTVDSGWAAVDSTYPVSFRVLRQDTLPLPGVVLHFVLDTLIGDSMPQNGAVFPDTAITDTAGVATVLWQLGSFPGTNHLTGIVFADTSTLTADFWVEGLASVQPDTLPPWLVAFAITPDTVLIDSAPGLVTFDMWFADDAGATDATVRLQAPDSSLRSCPATLTSGTPQYGQWTCGLLVSDSTPSLGTWIVEAVQVHGIGPDSLPGIPSSLLGVWTTGNLATLGYPNSFVAVSGGGFSPAAAPAVPPRGTSPVRERHPPRRP